MGCINKRSLYPLTVTLAQHSIVVNIHIPNIALTIYKEIHPLIIVWQVYSLLQIMNPIITNRLSKVLERDYQDPIFASTC